MYFRFYRWHYVFIPWKQRVDSLKQNNVRRADLQVRLRRRLQYWMYRQTMAVFGRAHHTVALGAKSAIYDCLLKGNHNFGNNSIQCTCCQKIIYGHRFCFILWQNDSMLAGCAVHAWLILVLFYPYTHTTILLLFWNMSGTTRVSRYQKGKTWKVKTNLDLLEQEVVSGSGICWAICKSAPHPRQPRQHPTTQFFYRLTF